MKKNKYKYLWVIQSNYGYGWDDVDQSENYKDAKTNLKLYIENETNCPYKIRIILRRVLND